MGQAHHTFSLIVVIQLGCHYFTYLLIMTSKHAPPLRAIFWLQARAEGSKIDGQVRFGLTEKHYGVKVYRRRISSFFGLAPS